jgi:hypothetical protein
VPQLRLDQILIGLQEGLVLQTPDPLREGQGTAQGRKGFEVLVGSQVAEGTKDVPAGAQLQHPVNGGRGRGQQQHPFPAGGGLGDDLGNHPGLPGPREALDQAEVGRGQGPVHRLALVGVQGNVTPFGGMGSDRFQPVGVPGQNRREEALGPFGKDRGRPVREGGELVGIKQPLALGQGEDFVLLSGGEAVKSNFPGRRCGYLRRGGRTGARRPCRGHAG